MTPFDVGIKDLLITPATVETEMKGDVREEVAVNFSTLESTRIPLGNYKL